MLVVYHMLCWYSILTLVTSNPVIGSVKSVITSIGDDEKSVRLAYLVRTLFFGVSCFFIKLGIPRC